VSADALVATRNVTGQTDWVKEALMLMRVRKKCNRDASVHVVALRLTPTARIGDGNCEKNRNIWQNLRLTATVLRDKVQQLHDS
jgi:hypothetical protein